MTPKEFIADTTAFLAIQTDNGKRIKHLKIVATFYPEGRTEAVMTWPVPKTPKQPKGQPNR